MLNTKMILKTTLAAVLTLSTFGAGQASAANGKGNGGIAYVCRNPMNNTIISARLLDLWEPETFKPFRDCDTSIEKQIENALAKIKLIPGASDTLVNDRIEIAKLDRFPVTKPLPLSDDAIPDYAPEKGCAFEQVASYGFVNETGEFKLRIYNEIYDSPMFSNSDRAALWVHEALYALDRELNDTPATPVTDSRKSRRVNARLFSNSELPANIRSDLLSLAPAGQSSSVIRNRSFQGEMITINATAVPPNWLSAQPTWPVCTIKLTQNGVSVLGEPEYKLPIRFGHLNYALLVEKAAPGTIDVAVDCVGASDLRIEFYLGKTPVEIELARQLFGESPLGAGIYELHDDQELHIRKKVMFTK